MTERVEVISKEIDGHVFTGLRLYLYLPVTLPDGTSQAGPFMHRDGDDASAAITFWGKRDLRDVLKIMQEKLNAHYDTPPALSGRQEDAERYRHLKSICESAGSVTFGDGRTPTIHHYRFPPLSSKGEFNLDAAIDAARNAAPNAERKP